MIFQGSTEKHKLQKVRIDGSRLRIFETIWYCIKQKVKLKLIRFRQSARGEIEPKPTREA